MKTLQTVGVSHEELWPYDPANLFVTPPPAVLNDAFQYKAFKYHTLKGSNVFQSGGPGFIVWSCLVKACTQVSKVYTDRAPCKQEAASHPKPLQYGYEPEFICGREE